MSKQPTLSFDEFSASIRRRKGKARGNGSNNNSNNNNNNNDNNNNKKDKKSTISNKNINTIDVGENENENVGAPVGLRVRFGTLLQSQEIQLIVILLTTLDVCGALMQLYAGAAGFNATGKRLYLIVIYIYISPYMS